MARIVFTPQLRRLASTPEVESAAATLGVALEDALAANPRLRDRVLDNRGRLRPNVAVLIDGRRCDAAELDEPLEAGSTVHVLQALSGG